MPIVIRDHHVVILDTSQLRQTDDVISLENDLSSIDNPAIRGLIGGAEIEDLRGITTVETPRSNLSRQLERQFVYNPMSNSVMSIDENTLDISSGNTSVSACNRCGDHVDTEPTSFTWRDYRLLCDSCWLDISVICVHCNEEIEIEAGPLMSLGGERQDPRHEDHVMITVVCNKCKVHYHQCVNCKRGFLEKDTRWKENVNGFCVDCVQTIMSRSSPQIRPLNLDSIPHEENRQMGEVIKSKRSFGIELEVQYHSSEDAAIAYLHLPHEVSVGTDGSINGSGIELRTPPIGGSKAEKMVRDVCKILRDRNFTIDASCGFHVHIDVNDIDSRPSKEGFTDVRDLWLFYSAFEDVIMSFLHPARRSNRRYCSPLKAEYGLKEIMEAQNMDRLEKLWYRVSTEKQLSTSDVTRAKGEHRHQSRYRGINLHPLFSDRHLEIRYHSGTMNPRKILEWTNLHLSIVDNVFNRGVNLEIMRDMADCIDLNRKTLEFFTYLRLPPESTQYFLARQSEFYVPPKFTKSNEDFKSAILLLQEEVES